jgi:cation:H+ antiporter
VPAVALFAAGVIVSLATSWLLVSRIERLGERLGLSEALLGIVAALAADTPEITAAVTAISGHQQNVGAGVVLGSNVFNLAALLGLGAVVAGGLALHRKVVALGGVVAMWIALVCVAVVAGVLPVIAGLVLTAAVLALYMVLLGTEGRGLERLRPPRRWQAWLRSAVIDEEIELEDAIRPVPGRWPDAATAAGALLAVIVSSVLMERTAADLGQRYGIPQIITGGLVLAAVTSLPNAVAAVYLAGRGRGAASLSTALNSNTINVIAGLLLPAALIGLHRPSGQAELVTAWYAGLSLAVLVLAYRHRGLSRVAGILIIAVYAAFVTSVVVSGYALEHAPVVITVLSVLSAVVLAAGLVPFARRRHSRPGMLGSGPGPTVPAFGGGSLVPGWSAARIWTLSLLLPSLIAAIDGAAGRHIVLIGFLIAGPCCALLTARWLLTAFTGLLAAGLAVVLGIPDGIWATGTHLTFIGSVVAVAASCTCAAALITKVMPERRI